MASMQTEAGVLGHAGGGSARRGQELGAMPEPNHRFDAKARAEGAEQGVRAPGSSAWSRARARYKNNVWLPVLGKAVAILCGMVALAAIGASSIARGSGAAISSGVPAASFLAGSFVPLSTGRPAAHGPSTAALAQAHSDGSAGSQAPVAPRSPGLTEDGKVILNQAQISDLRKLPGVGAKRAQAILDLRQKLGGRFRKVNELLRVKGIGPRTVAKWKDLLVLDAPQS